MMQRNSSLFLSALFLTLGLPFAQAEPAKFNKRVEIGQQAPDWRQLPGVDGKSYALADFKREKLMVVVFMANHCPIAGAYEPRFVELADKYRAKSVAFVAICVSDLPADNLEQMKGRAKASGFKFPYLHDASQNSAKSLGALVTPHLFIFDQDRKIAYMGAFDDHLSPEQVKRHYAADAIDALLAGQKVEVPESRPRGCPILLKDSPVPESQREAK